MISLRQKYFAAQGFCASVSIGAIALLFYFCSQSFTDLVGISAKNLNALYLSGELRSLLWSERTSLNAHLRRQAAFAEFEEAAKKVSATARAVEGGASADLRPSITEFIRIHDELRAHLGHADGKDGFASRASVISVDVEGLYDREFKQLNEFSEAVLLGSEDRQVETIHRTHLVMVGALCFAIAITVLILSLLFLYLRKYVVDPIVAISAASLEVARGQFHPIAVADTGDEIGVLAKNFNHMMVEVRRAAYELSELNRTLEMKVEERTAQLADAEGKLLAAARMSALGEMAGGVAHEINTPLGTISLVADQLQELVEEDPLDRTTVRKMTETIVLTVRRIGAIIKGMRTFSRDGSQDPLESATVRRIVEEALMLYGEKLKHRDVEIRIEPFADDLAIRCRPVQISQVLLSLIVNACDAVQSRPERWIRISAEKRGDFARISVTDSGKGIPEAARSKLFQPFYTTKEIGSGTGLGLSVSRGIVVAHHGTIELDVAAENTRFVLELPLGEAAALSKPRSA